MVKVIFDTNFWSYLVEYGKENEFLKLEDEFNMTVVLPPSILLEVEKTIDKQKRIAIIKSMNKANRIKSRTDADLECEEVIQEIRRVRSEYRNKRSDTKRIHTLRKFWQKKIWDLAIDKTDFYHQKTIQEHKYEEKIIIQEQNYLKKKLEFAKWSFNKTIPSELKAQFLMNDHTVPDFVDKNKEYEPWRIMNLYYYKKYLAKYNLPINHDDRTIVDWCEPWIKIKDFLKDEEQYYSFWLNEVKVENMPRNWLRWAINMIQPFKKIGSGNPYDDQHSSYMIDVDFFFTSDKRYYNCLELIYENQTIKMAKPILLQSDVTIAFNQIRDTLIQSVELN